MAIFQEELDVYRRRQIAVVKSYWGRRFVAEGAMTPELAQLAEREDAANMWHDRVKNQAEFNRLREADGGLQYVDPDDPELVRIAKETGEPTEFHVVCARPLNLEQHQQLYQGVEREGMSDAAVEHERKEAWAERERLIAEAQGEQVAVAEGELERDSPEWTAEFIRRRDEEDARIAAEREEHRKYRLLTRR
jgi:hypothetical protein